MPTLPEHVEDNLVRVPIEVRYAETDQMGVVHHANYVVWLELARTHHCRRSGFHYAELETMGYLLVVTRVELRYGRPVRYGEDVEVECRVQSYTSRGLVFAYRVLRGGDAVVEGTTHHIWVDAETRRPCRAPEPMREALDRLMEGPG